ncbi:unnamed protein product [Protopolystoma xenopodis]|uniref:Hexosyltransferase n=1 Tax=Protopolystoma xenopodis TaxID=117903 RepID=A0A448WFQ0_9PLAT|nr:unnamed protein product [Protopolystoma xenopodis]
MAKLLSTWKTSYTSTKHLWRKYSTHKILLFIYIFAVLTCFLVLCHSFYHSNFSDQTPCCNKQSNCLVSWPPNIDLSRLYAQTAAKVGVPVVRYILPYLAKRRPHFLRNLPTTQCPRRTNMSGETLLNGELPANTSLSQPVDLLLLVKSLSSHFSRREVIRNSWARLDRFKKLGLIVRRMFVVAMPIKCINKATKFNICKTVSLEANNFDDIVEYNHPESSLNSTNMLLFNLKVSLENGSPSYA